MTGAYRRLSLQNALDHLFMLPVTERDICQHRFYKFTGLSRINGSIGKRTEKEVRSQRRQR